MPLSSVVGAINGKSASQAIRRSMEFFTDCAAAGER
jgi:hypothetical protein